MSRTDVVRARRQKMMRLPPDIGQCGHDPQEEMKCNTESLLQFGCQRRSILTKGQDQAQFLDQVNQDLPRETLKGGEP